MSRIVLMMLICCGASGSWIDGNILSEELNRIANDGLGAKEVQAEFDSLSYRLKAVDGQQLAQDLSRALAAKFQEPIHALNQTKSLIESEYFKFTNTRTMELCCEATELKYDSKFKTAVNFTKACVAVSSQSPQNMKFPTQSIVDLMKQNHDDYPNLKWQYFGTEDGITLQYPSVDYSTFYPNCGDYDPRYRPFYVNAVTPVQKDVVIVLDVSRSMAANHRGRSLLRIAKEAAKSVIQALTPKDRVAIVAFSSAAHTPPGSARTGDCFAKNLAKVTPTNSKYLQAFVDSLQVEGDTNYGLAMKKAFQIFRSSEMENGTNNQVILFLSDGMASDGETVLEVIRDENHKLANSVRIFTYGLGIGLSKEAQALLHNMSQQVLNNASYGEIKNASFQNIPNPDDLRNRMSTFYNFLSSLKPVKEPLFTTPYVDLGGRGLVSSICLPAMVANQKLLGVACVGISMSDLLSDATYFRAGELSYAFIIDGNGRTMMHPLLPRPYFTHQEPALVNIEYLERSPEAQEVIQSMKRGECGHKSFVSTRTHSKGNVLHEGIKTTPVKSYYYWKPIESTNFSFCIVIGYSDRQAVLLNMQDFPIFTYHRMDLKPGNDMCKHYRRYAIKDKTTVMLTPTAFKQPYNYLENEENNRDISRYEDFLHGIVDENPGLKDTVRDSVIATYEVENIWKNKNRNADYLVWRSIGTIDGVIRVFPGIQLAKDFDHTRRPWYRRTLANKGKNVVTVPYLDGWGAGYVITFTNAIYEGKFDGIHSRSDKMVAVLQCDLTMNYFYQLVHDKFSACRDLNYSCFVIDSSGYVVIHDTFVKTSETKPKIEKVHIADIEPVIAQDLILKGIMTRSACTNFESFKDQYFWDIYSPSPVRSMGISAAYELQPVVNSNIFLIIKKTSAVSQPEKHSCRCPDKLTSPDAYQCVDTSTRMCECPCYTKAEYLYCQDTFSLTHDSWPTCTPIAPVLNASIGPEVEKIKDLANCYDQNCGNHSTKESCFSAAGCNWCESDNNGEHLQVPYCATQDVCYFGQEGVRCPYDYCTNSLTQDKDETNQTEANVTIGGIQDQENPINTTVVVLSITTALALTIASVALAIACLVYKRSTKKEESEERNNESETLSERQSEVYHYCVSENSVKSVNGVLNGVSF